MSSRISSLSLLRLALVAGLFAFGGGFAIISRIRQRVVDELGWVTEAEFTELIAVTAALPGVNAANLLTMVAARMAGTPMAVAACALFLLPGISIMLVFGIFYDGMRGAPGLGGALEGITAAVAGVVAAVADDLRPTALKRRGDALAVVVAFALLVTHTLGLLQVVALAALYGWARSRWGTAPGALAAFFVGTPTFAMGKTATLFTTFAKISLATFGGGIAMIPAVEREVLAHGWVQGSVFTDAVALAQVTPGPFATCATFLGYRAGGFAGAAASTFGIFVPPLLLALLVAKRLDALRKNAIITACLSGIAVAVVAAIAAAAFSIYRVGVHGVAATLVAIGAFAWRRYRPRDNALFPVAAGALFGLARALL